MALQMVYYLKINFVYNGITGPQLLFKYPGLEFIQPLSEYIMHAINVVLLISAILIAIGKFYRVVCVLFFLGYTYFILQDTTYFNNHYYLISLISFVLIFINADKLFVFGNKKNHIANANPTISNWNIWLLRFLIIIVYFFGGLAKMNPDWLSGVITASMIDPVEGDKVPMGLIKPSLVAQLFAYGGMLFDLLVGFLLCYKRTRIIGIAGVIIFNLLNAFFWDDIGIFPYLMIMSTIIFIEPEKIRKLIFKPKTTRKKKSKKMASQTAKVPLVWTTKKGLITVGLAIFVLFQLLFPLRHYLMTDNPDWTGIGSRFAWRMKAQTRIVEKFEMKFISPSTGDTQKIDTNSFLTENQRIHLLDDPQQVIQLARHISQVAADKGYPNLGVKADIKVRFNGRKAQNMFNPEIDLLTIDESNPDWIYPLLDR